MDRNLLKSRALLERLSSVTTEYEDRDADRRVEITILNERVTELEAEVNSLRATMAEVEATDEG